MRASSTTRTRTLLNGSFRSLALSLCVIAATTVQAESWSLDAPLKTPGAADDKAHLRQLSGIVVDASGAVVRDAAVQARSVNGNEQRTTQSDKNGSFTISALPPGRYLILVSAAGFEPKELSAAVGVDEASTPLRVPLAAASLKTTVTVQGREDDLVGVADSVRKER